MATWLSQLTLMFVPHGLPNFDRTPVSAQHQPDRQLIRACGLLHALQPPAHGLTSSEGTYSLMWVPNH